ncbi:MAG: glycosyl hydrolase 53 family protein [Nocardiopsaceae bacterium]|nr:glycosyl hydrolase 53 family protein [Nocardiopsaceae bacterium]
MAALPARPAAANGASSHAECEGFRVSLSVSPFTETVLGAVSLTAGRRTASTVREVQQLFGRHGATEVFARVATLQYARQFDAEYGFARAIERARLARDLGLPLNLELGLWPVYGDIRRQPAPDFSDYPSIRLPGPWQSLTLSQMESALRQYGALVARQILSTGVRVNFWDLGNEVEWGVAGVAIRSFDRTGYSPPDTVDPAIGQMTAGQLLGMPVADQVAWLQQHLWPYIGRLLAAAADGVLRVDHRARFSTHLASIGVQDASFHTAFWQAMNQAGYFPDQFGTSLYPTNGDPGDRKAVFLDIVTTLRQRFGRNLFFAEFSYPSGLMDAQFPWNNTQAGYPQTPEGQFRYLRDLVASSAATGVIAGIRPWAPDYCINPPGIWEPMSLFTQAGVAKPGLTAFQQALRVSHIRP